MVTLEFIARAISHLPVSNQPFVGETPLTSVVIDSRKVEAGGLFVALPGENSDGHHYLADAFQRGAAAAIIDQDMAFDCPTLDLRTLAESPRSPVPLETPVCLRVPSSVLALQEAARQWMRRFDARTIGVTGSVGKSTSKEVIADVLGRRYRVLKSEGSYNNELGIPLTVLQMDESIERVVLEMSMYTIGEIALLCSIAPPQVGVVTLIAPVHLERAGSMENIIQAKTELVEALPPAPEGVAILNMDDENVMGMAQHTDARIITYGLNPQADFWASDIEGLGLDGIRFWLHHRDKHHQIKLPMLGRHSVHTALLAAATALEEGMRMGDVLRALQHTRNQLRLLVVKGPNDSVVLDDTYNASPSSTIAALNLLNDLIDGRRIAVLGDMLELGAYEHQGHQRVGVRAAAVADVLITVGERGRMIAEEAIACGMAKESVHSLLDAEEAAALVLKLAQPGDTILVKGSRAVGMEHIVAALNVEGSRGE